MSERTRPEVDASKNVDARQYEGRIDGGLAGLISYRDTGDAVSLPHTEVFPRWEGMGVGGELARFAIDDIVAQGKKVRPDCPFIAAWIDKHPEYADHVA